MGQYDHEADELLLYLDNEEPIYRRKMTSFIPNVRRKIEQGKYDPALAPKLWTYLADDAAKKYAAEFHMPIFPPTVRRRVGEMLAERELASIMNGEYGPPPAFKARRGRRAHSPRGGGKFIVRSKSGKVVGRYHTRAEAQRRIAQLKAGAERLKGYRFR
jgi:hypothetical protein